jgi:hypothetical protein
MTCSRASSGSLDAPDLYFPGVALDGIGSAAWAFMLMARSVMSHIRGTAQLDMEPVGCRLNHFDMVRYLAERDSGTYAGKRGLDSYPDLALGTPDGQPYPLLWCRACASPAPVLIASRFQWACFAAKLALLPAAATTRRG